METEITITSAQYTTELLTGDNIGINATIDGVEMLVPLDENNRHYAEILRQVEAGTLTIEEAD